MDSISKINADSYYMELADKLERDRDLSDDEFASVLIYDDPNFSDYLSAKARSVREKVYGKDVYLRGLIEFTNYCRNNCNYCGILYPSFQFTSAMTIFDRSITYHISGNVSRFGNDFNAISVFY